MDTHAGIDLKTHHRSPKTRQVIKKTPYRLVMDGQKQMFEMPVGSENWVYPDGSKVPEDKHPRVKNKDGQMVPLPKVEVSLLPQEALQKFKDEKATLSNSNAELSQTNELLLKKIKMLEEIKALDAEKLARLEAVKIEAAKIPVTVAKPVEAIKLADLVVAQQLVPKVTKPAVTKPTRKPTNA